MNSTDPICQKLIEFIERFGQPAERLTASSILWDCFPDKGEFRELEEVNHFCNAVEDYFVVYLTESEWKSKTIGSLVETIKEHMSDPEKSNKTLDSDIKEIKKGTFFAFYFFSALAIGASILAWHNSNEPYRGILYYIGIFLAIEFLAIWVLYVTGYKDLQKLKRKKAAFRGRGY